jgi:hypothetical protein
LPDGETAFCAENGNYEAPEVALLSGELIAAGGSSPFGWRFIVGGTGVQFVDGCAAGAEAEGVASTARGPCPGENNPDSRCDE